MVVLASTPDAWSILVDYGTRLTPGIAVFVACLVVIPMSELGPRLAAYIALFILIRDGMTPAGLWSVDGFRMQLFDHGGVLAVLGATSVAGVVVILLVEPAMRPLLVWRKGRLGQGAVIGFGAGIVIASGSLAASGFSLGLGDRTLGFAVGLTVLAYGGNLLEEVLFRGYLQGWLAARLTPVRAAVISGVSFAACHTWLALTVTDGGWPILVFTAVEGLACAFVRLHFGIWAASLTHGTAIWMIATPL